MAAAIGVISFFMFNGSIEDPSPNSCYGDWCAVSAASVGFLFMGIFTAGFYWAALKVYFQHYWIWAAAILLYHALVVWLSYNLDSFGIELLKILVYPYPILILLLGPLLLLRVKRQSK